MADEPSNWSRAELDLETLAMLIVLIRELYEATGQWPTATALRAALRKPS